MNAGSHWENIYKTKDPTAVSWYRPHLERSLALIESVAPNRAASIVDAGGGESTLVDDLLEKGYQNLTVLDISEKALQVAKQRLGCNSDRVRWICADITQSPLAPQSCDVWHDRALFHFLIAPEERAAYVTAISTAMKRGGHVILSTFGPEGPYQCSGLPVTRYDAQSLSREFGPRFRLVESLTEIHQTPAGIPQQFLYCLFEFEGR
jgi:SAM-dependent methyltransferase